MTCEEDLEVLRKAKEAKDAKDAAKAKADEEKARRQQERRMESERTLHEAKTILYEGNNERGRMKLLLKKHYHELLVSLGLKKEMKGMRKDAMAELYWSHHVDVDEDPGNLPQHLVIVPTGVSIYSHVINTHTRT